MKGDDERKRKLRKWLDLAAIVLGIIMLANIALFVYTRPSEPMRGSNFPPNLWIGFASIAALFVDAALLAAVLLLRRESSH